MSELYLKSILHEFWDETAHGLVLNKHEDYSTLKFTAWVCCAYARRHGPNGSCHRAEDRVSCRICGVDFERPSELSWKGLHEELKNMQDNGI